MEAEDQKNPTELQWNHIG